MINLFWFRRDLRLDDNCALEQALKAGNVLPIFIFDPAILNPLPSTDKRVNFIHQQVTKLVNTLRQQNRAMLVFYGDPEQVFSDLLETFRINAIFANRDYEPAARARDTKIKQLATSKGVKFCRYKDHVIFEATEVLKKDNRPYTVFTPYSRIWMQQFITAPLEEYSSENKLESIVSLDYINASLNTIPSLDEMGFTQCKNTVCMQVPRIEVIQQYEQKRDFPAENGATLIGPHLRFGTLSIRKMAGLGHEFSHTWLRQLIWRDFFSQILFFFPETQNMAFRPAYNKIPWRNDPQQFTKWCQGKTGFPLIDAGMRELNQTGYMHNRVRMLCANFLTKLLLIDWRLGEAYFAQKLLDYDMSNNIGGWQWAAGSGCDAAPYFRIFNPSLQIDKFDPEKVYIKKWLPEYSSRDYVAEMIDYKGARQHALEVYKKALNH